jgi:tetratricopeptide (TPR) repeat protein
VKTPSSPPTTPPAPSGAPRVSGPPPPRTPPSVPPPPRNKPASQPPRRPGVEVPVPPPPSGPSAEHPSGRGYPAPPAARSGGFPAAHPSGYPPPPVLRADNTGSHPAQPVPPAAGSGPRAEPPKPAEPKRSEPKREPLQKSRTEPVIEAARTQDETVDLADPRLGLIMVCKRELATGPDAARAARLHFEIGRSISDEGALVHFREALALLPDHLPSIQAARRLLLRAGDMRGALELFDAEIRLADDARERARLLFAKGRALEDVAGDLDGARAAYRVAVELDQSSSTHFRALEQAEIAAELWSDLARAREGAANAVRGDSRHRAALLCERARLYETRLDRGREAVELYEQALELDPTASGALQALKRLLYAQERWRELCSVLEREAARTTDVRARTYALYHLGRIIGERLGLRDESLRALARALQATPSDRLVHETLARIYEAAGEHQHLAVVLAHAVETIASPEEKLPLLHRIGALYELEVGDAAQAQRWYEGALGIDATYAPVVAALDALYQQSQAWEALIVMHMAITEKSPSTGRRAAAHARIAELFELRMGRPDEAIRHYRQTLVLEPAHEAAFKALVRLFTEHRVPRDLIELYERALERATEHDVIVAYLFKIGSLYEDVLGEPAHALHAYRRILVREPDQLGAIHAVQRAAERALRFPEVVEALEHEARLTVVEKRRVELLHRAGEVLHKKVGDREAAVLRFRAVLEIERTHAASLSSLAGIFHAAGRHAELRHVWERELEITPKGAPQAALLYKLGELCEHELGDADEAVAYYRRAISADNGHGPSLRALEYQLRRRRDFKALVGTLTTELNSEKNPETRAACAYRLGEVYEIHLGQLERAVTAYQQALEAVPHYRPAVDSLVRVRARMSAWEEEAGQLALDATRVQDHRAAIDAFLRAGQIYDELLARPDRATTMFEAVRAIQHDNLAALLALEPLYRHAGRWRELVDVYATQAGVLGDPRARIAALEELGRLYQRHGMGDAGDLRRVYAAILSIDGIHGAAVRGLEQMALDTGDRALLADVDARVARGATDPTVIAAHRTRLGESLEATNPQAALEAYRAALDHEPDNIAAIRGLGRAARACDDVGVMIDAYGREAAWTRDGALAADVLTARAKLRLERRKDGDGAIEDATRALERWPDHEASARLLGELLRDSGQIERLIGLLSRAASTAREPGCAAALWRSVARLYAEDKNDLGAGLAAVERALASERDNAQSLQLLGDLLGKNRQWTEAADAYRRAVRLGPPPADRLLIELSLGRLLAKQLKDLAGAVQSLEAVIAIDDRHREALLLLLDLHHEAGDFESARRAAQRLVAIAVDVTERAWALRELGRLELRAGRRPAAAQALREAVALEGPSGPAAGEYKKLLGDDEPWERYVEALHDHLRRVQRGEVKNNQLRDVYVALARIQHEVLLKVDDAVRSLRAGLEATQGDAEVHHELAERLATIGRADEALAEYRRIVAREPASIRAWRGMARTYHEAGRKLESAVALAPLVVLGESTELEASMARQRRVLPGVAKPGSFVAEVLGALSAGEPQEESRILGVLAALYESLPKLYPPEFERYGVSVRDRVREGQALRQLCDRVAQGFAIGEYELYVHRGAASDVVIELTQPPSLMLPQFVADLPEAQQVFVVARAFTSYVRGAHAVYTVGRREAAKLVIAGLRCVNPTFGINRWSDDEIGEPLRRLQKALSRKSRRMLEQVAVLCLDGPPPDVERWTQSFDLSTARIGALLANDLPAAISVLRQTGATPARIEGVALVRASPALADLLRFWVSEPAMDLRRNAGII